MADTRIGKHKEIGVILFIREITLWVLKQQEKLEVTQCHKTRSRGGRK